MGKKEWNFPMMLQLQSFYYWLCHPQKNTNPNHDSMTQTPDCATSWKKKKYILKQAHFFPLYTQKADHAAMKEIRDENLARFSFCKAIVLVQIQRD